MTGDEAARVASMLVASTTGWNDDAVDALLLNMEHTWNDAELAHQAIEHVVNSWTALSRPPWGVLADAYRQFARRRALEAAALEAGDSQKVVSFERGRAIVAFKYAEACGRRDPNTDVHILSGFRSTEPNQKIIDGFLNGIGEMTPSRRAKGRP